MKRTANGDIVLFYSLTTDSQTSKHEWYFRRAVLFMVEEHFRFFCLNQNLFQEILRLLSAIKVVTFKSTFFFLKRRVLEMQGKHKENQDTLYTAWNAAIWVAGLSGESEDRGRMDLFKCDEKKCKNYWTGIWIEHLWCCEKPSDSEKAMLSRCVHSCVMHVHGLKGILKVKTANHWKWHPCSLK